MLVSELARLMSLIIVKNTNSLSEDHWDGVRLALSSWVLTIAKSKQDLNKLKVMLFCQYFI